MARAEKPGKVLKSLFITLIFGPIIALPVLLLPLFSDVSLIADRLDLYIIFIGIPWTLAAITWFYLKRAT